jgi:alpha-galactosidase
MLASPLMAGNDVQNMSAENKAILTNKEVIALDQDTLGKQAILFRDNGDYQIWMKRLANKERAICLLNKSDEKKSVLVDFALLSKARFERWGRDNDLKLENYTVRDLWDHKDLPLKETSMYIDMPPHSVKVYRYIRK